MRLGDWALAVAQGNNFAKTLRQLLKKLDKSLVVD